MWELAYVLQQRRAWSRLVCGCLFALFSFVLRTRPSLSLLFSHRLAAYQRLTHLPSHAHNYVVHTTFATTNHPLALKLHDQLALHTLRILPQRATHITISQAAVNQHHPPILIVDLSPSSPVFSSLFFRAH